MKKLAMAMTFALFALGAHTAGAQSYGGNRSGGSGQLGNMRPSTRQQAPTANDLNRANLLAKQATRRRTPRKQGSGGWAHGSRS